jgi:hypothetical protein
VNRERAVIYLVFNTKPTTAVKLTAFKFLHKFYHI